MGRLGKRGQDLTKTIVIIAFVLIVLFVLTYATIRIYSAFK